MEEKKQCYSMQVYNSYLVLAVERRHLIDKDVLKCSHDVKISTCFAIHLLNSWALLLMHRYNNKYHRLYIGEQLSLSWKSFLLPIAAFNIVLIIYQVRSFTSYLVSWQITKVIQIKYFAIIRPFRFWNVLVFPTEILIEAFLAVFN